MKNRHERIKKNIRILLKDEDDSYPGTIVNFSKTGMSIKTEHVFPTYKVIEVGVKIGQKVIPLKGSVRWVKEGPVEAGGPQHLVGISLVNPPAEYLKYFE